MRKTEKKGERKKEGAGKESKLPPPLVGAHVWGVLEKRKGCPSFVVLVQVSP